MVIMIEVVVLARNRLTRDGERGGRQSCSGERSDLVVFWMCFVVKREGEEGRSLNAGREKGRMGVEREKKKNKKRK
jgi:hypothetical protein